MKTIWWSRSGDKAVGDNKASLRTDSTDPPPMSSVLSRTKKFPVTFTYLNPCVIIHVRDDV